MFLMMKTTNSHYQVMNKYVTEHKYFILILEQYELNNLSQSETSNQKQYNLEEVIQVYPLQPTWHNIYF